MAHECYVLTPAAGVHLGHPFGFTDVIDESRQVILEIYLIHAEDGKARMMQSSVTIKKDVIDAANNGGGPVVIQPTAICLDELNRLLNALIGNQSDFRRWAILQSSPVEFGGTKGNLRSLLYNWSVRVDGMKSVLSNLASITKSNDIGGVAGEVRRVVFQE